MPQDHNRDWSDTPYHAEVTAAQQLLARYAAVKPRTNGPSYDRLWQQISINWVAAHGNPFTVSVTLETPWNTPYSTSAGYRVVGRDLAQTIEKFLRDDPRK